MYAFGDDQEPLQESVNVLDEIVTECVTSTNLPHELSLDSIANHSRSQLHCRYGIYLQCSNFRSSRN